MACQLEKRQLGDTGLEVTLLGFGALEIGRDWGLGDTAQRQRPDEETAAEVLNGVLDLGITLIDTARAYHRSEERIGRYIGHRRGEYVLSSKCGEHSAEPNTYYDFSYRAVKDSIDLSLELLHTDVIDVMHIHFGPQPEKVLDEGETVRAMRDAQAEGKIRFLGASVPLSVLARCIESDDFDVVQVGYSLLDRAAEPLIERAAERGIGVLIRTGLGMGRLTSRVLVLPEKERPLVVRRVLELVGGDGEKLTALGLAFLRRNPAVSSILVGSKNLAHVRTNIHLLFQGVDPGLLEEAARIAAA